MTVKKAKCNNFDAPYSKDYSPCLNVARYPLYQYGTDGKLHPAGDHYVCLDKTNNEIDTAAVQSYSSDDECLQVIVYEKADEFCWTPDPWTPDTGLWDVSDTRGIAELLDFTPVHNNLAYIDTNIINAFILKTYPISSLEGWREYFNRKLSWGWPG